MKKFLAILMCGAVAISATACAGNSSSQTQTSETTASEAASEASIDETAFDPYAEPTATSVDDSYFEKKSDVDYGTVEKDVEYYSETAEDYKQCNILLPAGYDESKTYPVIYVIHGWGSDHTAMVNDDTWYVLMYGNLLNEGKAEPMITVGVDMYTGKQADKEDTEGEDLRRAYDKLIQDIRNDLMPFISENYSVASGRLFTAVAGQSEGGAKSLANGFVNQDLFGYIGSFAPDPGVIPTPYYSDSYWGWPIIDEFEITDGNDYRYVYLSVGSEDPWNVEVTEYFGEKLDEAGIKNTTEVVEGYAHDADFWRVCYYNYLQRIFK